MRNLYPGPCYRCEDTVQPGHGHYEIQKDKTWKVQHAGCAIFFRELVFKGDRRKHYKQLTVEERAKLAHYRDKFDVLGKRKPKTK